MCNVPQVSDELVATYMRILIVACLRTSSMNLTSI